MPEFDARDIAPIPPRPPEAHKGSMGRVVIVGGSRGLTGAVALAAGAAMRAGAGLVTCALPASLNDIIEVKTTEAMSLPLPEDGQGNLVPEALIPLGPLLESAQAVVIGPGSGRQAGTTRFLAALIEGLTLPHLIDADGLWHLAQLPEILRRGHPQRVLTPHPGEMKRLLRALEMGDDVDDPAAMRFGIQVPGVLVLKGSGTLVIEGECHYRNRTGNPGLATGGSGDVLSGIIGAFLGRGDEPWDAAIRGVYLHGRAGDLARETRGEESLIASDIIDALPEAILEFQQRT